MTAPARPWSRVAETLRLMIGLPDNRRYVEHRQTRHPGEPVMSYPEFFRECQSRRYDAASGRGARCC